jgi:hypothetical protein
MAKQLVSGMVERWKPSQYHDEYRDDLLARIDAKAKARREPPTAAELGTPAERKEPRVGAAARFLRGVPRQYQRIDAAWRQKGSCPWLRKCATS